MSEPYENNVDCSFIIPALNEEHYIQETLSAIERYASSISYEIIVCDHGSEDRTRDIAVQHGAHVIEPRVPTIAGLRNAGVKVARGAVLIFIDADVSITEEWGKAIVDTWERLLQNEQYVVTGSHCDAGVKSNTFYDLWFKSLKERSKAPYIATTHLIVTRELFDNVGGFNEQLVTGEDYEFCRRAHMLGASITPNPALRAVHKRLPKTLKDFIRRERWHGVSDAVSFTAFLSSKVAVASMLFLVLHIFLVALVLLGSWLAWLPFLGLAGLLLMSIHIRFGRIEVRSLGALAVMFYLYYFGRSTAFFPMRRRRWTS